MKTENLESVARKLVAAGRGILAADESSGTIEKRLKSINVPSTVLLRRRDIDAFQSLFDGTRTFIGCQNSPARCDKLSCYTFQIFSFHKLSFWFWKKL